MMFTACLPGKESMGRADSPDSCTECRTVRLLIRLVCIDFPHVPEGPGVRSALAPHIVLPVDRGNLESACRN
jgi:hypothetical protein